MQLHLHPSLPKVAAPAVASQPMLFGSPELKGIAIPFSRNEEIFGEGEAAEFVYKVLSGSVRSYRLLSDGRRQISGFYLPGDIFGVEFGEEHCSSAEAVGDCSLLLVKRSSLLKLAERDHGIGSRLLSVIVAELKRSRSHGLLLIKSAQERLAAFLLEMAERLAGNGAVELPMSRQDIADYLGLTIETVSRTLNQFAQSSMIQLVASRQIVLRNQLLLSEMNS
jgi:CRP/FNR family transcriptional regulator, nitrogen fixation regulation protein